MSDTPTVLKPPGSAGHALDIEAAAAAGSASEDNAAGSRNAYRLIYLAMLFSIALGLMFASDSLVSYSYDLPQHDWTDRVGLVAEEWHRDMENSGLTNVPDVVRGWVAEIRGD